MIKEKCVRITGRRKSLEPCTESGWEAYDILLEAPLCEEDVLGLKQIDGSYLFLRQLKKPFFKIENHQYVIKGVLGDPFFRVAAHRDALEVLERFEPAVSDT